MNKDVHKKMASLQQSYADKLPARLEQMEKTWKELVEEDWSAVALSNLWQETHKLSGSAGLYGFNKVGIRCSKIEKAIEENSRNKPSDEVMLIINEMITTLKDEMRRDLGVNDD